MTRFCHLASNRKARRKNRKKTMKTCLIFVCLAFLASSRAEVVTWSQCPNYNPDPATCTVHEVRVTPCAEAAQDEPCRIKKGRSASISFDFTPNFAATALQTRAYWVSPLGELPFVGMETNACTHATTCPLESGKKQSYTMQLPISKKFPARTYDVKWRLWNDKEQDCCFVFKINLHK